MCLHSQTEREEFETEYKQKNDRERAHLTEENKKLTIELEKVRSWRYSTSHVSFIAKTCIKSFSRRGTRPKSPTFLKRDRNHTHSHTYIQNCFLAHPLFSLDRGETGISQSNNSASLNRSDIKGLLIICGVDTHYSYLENTWKLETQRPSRTIVRSARAVMSNARLDEV